MSKKIPKDQRLPGADRERYQENRENYRANLQGRSNEGINAPQDLQDEEKGKWVTTDVYEIGKKKTNLVAGTKKDRRRIREIEASLDTPRIFSSREFLDYYRQAQEAVGQKEEPAVETKKPRKRGKKSAPPDESAWIDRLPSSINARRARKNVGSEPGQREKGEGLRIIGGHFRGVRLLYSGDNRVRPMKDRVREALFNLMGTETKGTHVIDLFAGTGALALEAISRGATSATMIEVHFPTAGVTRANLATLAGLDAARVKNIELITTDVFFWGKSLPNRPNVFPPDKPWLVFCSPPYDFYIERQEEMLELLATLYRLAPVDSLFVVESDARFDFDLLGVPLLPRKRRSYPPAEIGIYRKEE